MPLSSPPNGVVLCFQRDSIDATLWLVSRAWYEAQELVDHIEGLQRQIDTEAKASEASK